MITKPRSLNMQEKRRLETLLIEDIDRAASDFKTKSHAQREALVKKIEANPPADARALLATYIKAQKQLDDAETKLSASGWDIEEDGDTYTLEVETRTYSNYHAPESIQSFDRTAEAKTEQFAQVKRTYIRKLFAEGAEAKDLLNALTQELAKLTV